MPKAPLPANVLELRGKSHHVTKEEMVERKEAEAALSTGTDKLDPPKWLRGLAKDHYLELCEQLLGIGIMTNVDVPMLAIYCNSYRKWQLEKDPRVQRQLMGDVKTIGAEFGLTPTSRAKLVTPKKKKKPKTQFEEDFGDDL